MNRHITCSIIAITLSVISTPKAHAWECLKNVNASFPCSPTTCRWAPGNDMEYRIRQSFMPSQVETGVIAAANEWSAGSGELIRGADWQYIQGPTFVGTWNTSDNENAVMMRPASWFSDNGITTALAAQVARYGGGPNCGLRESDIAIKNTIQWYDGTASATPSTDRSIQQVMVHEFGHGVGLDHLPTSSTQSFPTAMNPTYPSAGELGGITRVHEDEADALRDEYPHSSTGRNLMLGRFSQNPSGGGAFPTREGWTDQEIWDLDPTSSGAEFCPGDQIQDNSPSGAAVPSPLLMNYVGTGSATSIRIRYYWQPVNPVFGMVGTCGDTNSEYWYGIIYSSDSINNPRTVSRSKWIVPSSTAEGYYVPCAMIDPLNAYSETSEDDNTVYGEGLIHVLDGADNACL